MATMDTTTYDPASVSQQLVGISATQTITNKNITATQINVAQASGVSGTSDVGKILLSVNGEDPNPTPIPYDISNGGMGISSAGNWTSGSGGVIYQTFTYSEANGTTHDVAGFGTKSVAISNNMDVWGATSVAATANGTTGCSAHGLEIGIINQGNSSNNTYGLVVVGDGNLSSATSNDVAIQIQVQRASPTGTGRFNYGIVFNNSPARVVETSLIYADSPGGGFTCVNGIDFDNANFGFYDITTKNFRVEGGGTIDFRTTTTYATAGSLAGYFALKIGGVLYKVPRYNV